MLNRCWSKVSRGSRSDCTTSNFANLLDKISYWLGTWISPLRSLLSNYYQQKQVSLQLSQSLQTLNNFLFDIYNFRSFMVLHSSSSQTKQHSQETRYRYELFVAEWVSPPPPSPWSALLQHCSSLASLQPGRPRTEAVLHTPQLQQLVGKLSMIREPVKKSVPF